MMSSGYILSPGKNDSPMLVLSHSLGTDFNLWNLVLEPLEERFRILRYDPHPVRDSNMVEGTISEVGIRLIQLLDRLGLERVNFCGVSVSGLLGQWLALEAPNRLDKLILCNTAARIGTPAAWQERINLIRKNGLSRLADYLVNRWFSSDYAAKQPEIVERFAADLRLFPVVTYLAGCEAIRDADFRDRANQIKTRTLIIAGQQDRAATPADADLLHDQIHLSQLVSFPCGHLACVEQPTGFTQALVDFLTHPDSC